MKLVINFFLVLIFSLKLLSQVEQPKNVLSKHKINSFVKTEFSLSKKTLKKGEKGFLQVTFTTLKKGIHVNAMAPFETIVDTLAPVEMTDSVEIVLVKDTTFVNTKKPYRQEFLVKATASAGEHIIKGKFIYMFCSEDEGWCNRFVQPFEVSLKIVQ
jgi:hypothetical protein